MMCAKYKSAFTLAETIMTLAIVGVVITAAIPTMTTKYLSDNSKLKAYCANHADEARCQKLNNNLFRECGAARNSICTDNNITIGENTPPALFDTFETEDIRDAAGAVINQVSRIEQASFHLTYNSLNNPVSLYNPLLSGTRLIRIGDYYMRERGDNFFLTTDVDANNNHIVPLGTRNTILGSIQNAAMTIANLENNTIMGAGNNLDGCIGDIINNVIYGINNTLSGNGTSNSIIYGGGNNVAHSNSLVFGAFNTTSSDNSVIIGQGIVAPENQNFSIGNVITSNIPAAGANRTIDFSAPVRISGSFTGIFLHNSDIRLKNIQGEYTKGLKEILQVNPVEFAYNSDNTGTLQIGVIAQDIQKIFPEAVVKMPNGYLGVDNDPIFFAMLNALKEINEQKNAEEQRHKQLLKELEEVEKDLKASNKKAKNTFFYDIWAWITDIFSAIGGLLNA